MLCSMMLGLQRLRLFNTTVSGPIPAELGDLAFLFEVDIRDSLMTCCATATAAEERYENGTLLPPFLVFDNTYTLAAEPHVL